MVTFPPLFNLLFPRQTPEVKLVYQATNGSALTTYTFSGAQLPPFGSVLSLAADTSTDIPLRSSGKKYFFVSIHADDSATAFSISSCTIGGVAGTEVGDRGGGTIGTNSGGYLFNTDSLHGITNTDIVVTWSEAVVSCSIGVFEISNVGALQFKASASNQSTGAAVTTTVTGNIAHYGNYALAIAVATLSSNASATFRTSEPDGGGSPWQLLLEYNPNNFSNAAVAYCVLNQYPGANSPVALTSQFSVSTDNDVIIMVFA